MELYIIRHAEAEFPSLSGVDSDRHLTENGRLQAIELGRFFYAQNTQPELIITSPYERTIETSHLISQGAGIDLVQPERWLSAGMHPEVALTELQAYREFSSVILVGHQPDLSYLIHLLDPEQCDLRVDVASVHQFCGSPITSGGDIRRLDVC